MFDTKPILRIKFSGFWSPDDIIFEHYFKNSHRFLFTKYDVKIDNDNPDVIFCSVFSVNPADQIQNHNCSKIMIIHENIRPNNSWFDMFDYVISFTKVPHERHYKIPYWIYRFYEHGYPISHYMNKNLTIKDLLETKTRFCNFVYSNPFFFRREFAHQLSDSYKRVDFAGAVDTNISEEEKSLITPSKLGTEGLLQKTNFLKQYRFTLTFENSSTSGYTTEKILDAYAAQSIPLYWGNINILREGFNRESFLNYIQTPGNEQFIERIKSIDSNENMLLDTLNANMLITVPDELNSDYMLQLYEKMIENPKNINNAPTTNEVKDENNIWNIPKSVL